MLDGDLVLWSFPIFFEYFIRQETTPTEKTISEVYFKYTSFIYILQILEVQ